MGYVAVGKTHYYFLDLKFGKKIALNLRCKNKHQTTAVEGRWNHVYNNSKPEFNEKSQMSQQKHTAAAMTLNYDLIFY